jgi:hypothetical protein
MQIMIFSFFDCRCRQLTACCGTWPHKRSNKRLHKASPSTTNCECSTVRPQVGPGTLEQPPRRTSAFRPTPRLPSPPRRRSPETISKREVGEKVMLIFMKQVVKSTFNYMTERPLSANICFSTRRKYLHFKRNKS